MKYSVLEDPVNVSFEAKIIWRKVMLALQQAEEIGGTKDLQDYINLLSHIQNEIQARVDNAMYNK